MQTRAGFVSNSSSSSFIIKKGEDGFTDILELAKLMITHVLNQQKGRAPKYDRSSACRRALGRIQELQNTTHIQEYIKYPKLADITSVWQGIRFSTTNFDTFILDVGHEFWVATSSNHNFEECLNAYRDRVRERDDDIAPDCDINQHFIEMYLGRCFAFLDLEE